MLIPSFSLRSALLLEARTTRSSHVAFRGLGLIFVLLGARRSNAQSSVGSPPGYKEYLALLGTPIASLPPLGTYTLFGVAQQSPELAARYGYVPDIARPLAPSTGGHDVHSLGSFGLTGVIPTGLDGTISLTAGVSNERCSACSTSRFMGSVGSDYRVISTSIDAANATRLTIATSGELSVGGGPGGGASLSADVGVPLAIVVGPTTGTQIIPFVTPSFAYIWSSQTNAPGSNVKAGRLLVGGGASLFNPKSALGASVGFQYVFVSHTQLQFGVSVTLGGR